jgi:hypothetical protein
MILAYLTEDVKSRAGRSSSMNEPRLKLRIIFEYLYDSARTYFIKNSWTKEAAPPPLANVRREGGGPGLYFRLGRDGIPLTPPFRRALAG